MIDLSRVAIRRVGALAGLMVVLAFGVAACKAPAPPPVDVAQRLLDQIDPKWGSYEVP